FLFLLFFFTVHHKKQREKRKNEDVACQGGCRKRQQHGGRVRGLGRGGEWWRQRLRGVWGVQVRRREERGVTKLAGGDSDRALPIKSNTGGTLIEGRVDKGHSVKKGQVLAVVSDPELVFKDRQKDAELKEMQQRADEKSSPVLGGYDSKLTAMNDQLEIAK